MPPSADLRQPAGSDPAADVPPNPADVDGVLELPAGTDCWALHDAGFWVLVPTNRQTHKDGTAVMGAGLAQQAARRFPDLPARYGSCLRSGQDRAVIADHRLLLGPTKDHWRAPAIPALVTALLAACADWAARGDGVLVLAAPGCGLGGLPWPTVRAQALDALDGQRAILLPPR